MATSFTDRPIAEQARLAAFCLGGLASTFRARGHPDAAEYLLAMGTALSDLAHDLDNLEDPDAPTPPTL